MRAHEFTNEQLNFDDIYDIGEYQIEEIRQVLRSRPALFESSEEYQKIIEFLNNFNVEPMISTMYFPISVTCVPVGKVMSVSYVQKEVQLVRITKNNLYFEINGKSKPFPYDRETGDMLQKTILCKSLEEQDQFTAWLTLSFDTSWQIFKRLL